jgi:hypothetical protein
MQLTFHGIILFKIFTPSQPALIYSLKIKPKKVKPAMNKAWIFFNINLI